MKFSNNLKELLKEYNVTQNRLAEAIGFSQRAVSKWVNDQAEPTETAIVACARFFGVTTDEILGLEESPFSELPTTPFPREENELLKFYRQASTFEKARILAYAEFICDEKNKENN